MNTQSPPNNFSVLRDETLNHLSVRSLKIGPYTLPLYDGLNGQTLTTNGKGQLSWQ